MKMKNKTQNVTVLQDYTYSNQQQKLPATARQLKWKKKKNKNALSVCRISKQNSTTSLCGEVMIVSFNVVLNVIFLRNQSDEKHIVK